VQRKKKKLFLRISLVVLTVLVLVAGITPVIISTRYEAAIEKNLPRWVAMATDSLYRVTVEDISISTFTKNITLSGITLSPDSQKVAQLKRANQLPSTLFSLSIDKIEANEIHWSNLLADREFSCGIFSVYQPKISISKPDSQHIRLEVLVRKGIKINRLKAGKIQVFDPEVNYYNSMNEGALTFLLKGGKIELSDWTFDPLVEEDTSLFFYARKGIIAIDSAVLKKQNSLYAFKTGNIEFESGNNNLVLKNLAIEPAMTRNQYYKYIGHRDELFTVKFPSLSLKGFDWQQLSKGNIILKSVVADSPYIDIFLDRTQPRAPRTKKVFPSQILLAATAPIAIDSLQINNATINYTELSEKSKLEGTLPLSSCYLTLTNITNLPQRIQANNSCKATLKASLLGSPLKGTFNFPLEDKTGKFDATIHGGKLDGTKLNILTKPLASMEIESLELKEANISMAFDGKRATADFRLFYNDLDLKLLKSNEDTTFSGKGILSFIINKALLYKANPMPDESVRRISTFTDRSPDQSFFNLLWSTIRKGALLTAGRNTSLADAAEEKAN